MKLSVFSTICVVPFAILALINSASADHIGGCTKSDNSYAPYWTKECCRIAADQYMRNMEIVVALLRQITD
ncbi:hypothetical protein E3Q22_03705 [Wallemia mellicola]|uniref:Uncharacterized protein n=1 Tax=Wallemia mellicola TaxID=1708541 RepID=A0A4T0SHE2_9BASI|nr:hypothetical protein E3Q22_03705 [Wallemia mellicola]TIB87575.1 hypothetical protein E3Q19_03577 [Wallemia mellicola]TIB95470.1 hypothetical protein E3Q18_03700 [Wallemia mellicola]TIC09264.1 hypothetical protein E3Q15_03613 [Wallemia mellicola]TIC13878.1 hypothetical protein E3Q13_03781 [Wallemia mellicola]